ncbi:hypothetical protein GCM10028827_36810 [Mucilaginibacter myungsuensis]
MAQDANDMPLIIKGKVYKEGTDTALVNASVYYGGTMSGTSTGKDGSFELRAKAQQIPFIVSCVGYYSATVKYKPGTPLVVYLKPKVEELNTVTIKIGNKRKSGMSRNDEVQMFIDEFIGGSDFAANCTILNINDVQLFYDRKTETLTASSYEPIIVENRSLGYRISYFLDKFEKGPKQLAFSGNYIFRPYLEYTPDSVKENRERAYLGSRMQFIRNVWRRTLDKVGYRVFTNDYAQLSENNISTSDSTDQKYMLLIRGMHIVNSKLKFLINTLTVSENLVFIDKDGYYGPGLRWAGGMGLQRIGDLLPYEYVSADEQKQLAQPDPVDKK